MKYPVRKLFRTYINVSVINYIHFENYIQVILFSALRFPRQVYFLSFFITLIFHFFKFLLTLTPSDGSTATLAKAKRLTHFYSVALLPGKWFACFPSSGDGLILAYTGQNINTRILCQILHSTPYFFISLFPTAFFLRSRMTGRYLVTFRKKLFFRFCSHLPLPTACVLHFIVL